jgi:hypothetical protein
MMYRKIRLASAAALLLAAIIVSTGCSNNTSPMDSGAQTVKILERPQGPNSKPAALTATATVDKKNGATLVVGDDNGLGMTVLTIPLGAVDKKTHITMNATTAGPIFVELGPHGTVFNPEHPVTLEISFKGADLTDVDVEAIKVYYNNETTGLWEPLDNSVPDSDGATVTATLAHFSEYAPGSEE